ncbi:MAG TPA: hypothetical protein VG937_23940 [Polyangiaceae bacterium]|nr:hypothetical protein [Polyangiaceae bacterium]
MESFLTSLLWAFFFALPCAVAGIVGADVLAPKLRTPFGHTGRLASLFRVATFFVLAVVAFAVLLAGCVLVPMRLGL